jgi:hypothetical protein
MMRTCWGHIGNKEQKQKITHPTPPHLEKEKSRAHHECVLSLPIGCMQFLFPKLFVTIFWPGLMVGAEIWGHREHIGNLMGTHWELERNTLGIKEK